jgi:hypothetical protein
MGNAPLGHEMCGHVLTTPEEQTLVRDLHLTLTKLHARLPVLYQHVSGPFLSGL